MIVVYAAVLLWAALLGLRVYRYDMYNKAPWAALLLAVLCGFFVMAVVGDVEDRVSAALGIRLDDLCGRAFIAATHEQSAALLLVIVIALVLRRRFNDPMDGLIYGAFTGLGMALEESLFYLSLTREPGLESIGHEAIRILLHILLGGLSAFAVGMAAGGMKRWPQALAGWWATSVILHFLWDFLIGLPQATLGPAAANSRITAIFLMLGIIALFGGSVILASGWSRRKFDPDSRLRIWGWPFAKQPHQL